MAYGEKQDKTKCRKNFLWGRDVSDVGNEGGGCCKYATVERVLYIIYLPPPPESKGG